MNNCLLDILCWILSCILFFQSFTEQKNEKLPKTNFLWMTVLIFLLRSEKKTLEKVIYLFTPKTFITLKFISECKLKKRNLKRLSKSLESVSESSHQTWLRIFLRNPLLLTMKQSPTFIMSKEKISIYFSKLAVDKFIEKSMQSLEDVLSHLKTSSQKQPSWRITNLHL